MGGFEEPQDYPFTEHIDPEAAQRELEAAGWVRMVRMGKIVWQNPESGHLYPQGAAVSLVRRKREGNRREVKEPEGGVW